MEVLNIPISVPSIHPTTFGTGVRGRLKAWLLWPSILTVLRLLRGPIIFFAENLLMGCCTTYNAPRVLHTIWIAPDCHQTTHLLFWRAVMKWPRNGRKSCSCVRTKSWKSLIYYPMSSQSISRHLVHGSRKRLKAWLIAFNFDRFRAAPGHVIFFTKNFPTACGTTYNAFGCFAPSELPWIASKWPIYYLVVQTIVKVVLMPVQIRGSH